MGRVDDRQWGGLRQGAGRPVGSKNKTPAKIKVTYRLSADVVDYLRTHSTSALPQSLMVEMALRDRFKIGFNFRKQKKGT
jgi:hypothetical protein